LIHLWRRCSQFTAGLSTAAKKRATTNQPTKVLTCHRRKSAPSTTTTVSRATATTRATCDVGAFAQPTSRAAGCVLGSALGSAGTAADLVGGCSRCSARGFFCAGFSSSIFLAPSVLLTAASLGPHEIGRYPIFSYFCTFHPGVARGLIRHSEPGSRRIPGVSTPRATLASPARPGPSPRPAGRTRPRAERR
jgi:hypothetical protein